MASSPLEVVRVALEARIDELGRALSLCTAIVVLGLIFEYGAEIAERVPKNWKPKKEAKSFRWIGLWWFIGMLFITGGVAGELTIGVLASRTESKLRDLNNEFSTQLRQDAMSAAQDAGGAKEDATDAADVAHKARLKADSFEAQIKAVTQEATAAENDLAQARPEAR